MSGIIGHTVYAILGAQAAARRKLPMVSWIARHGASYLAGAYLGCDIQTLPEAICADTGKEVGYGTVPLDKSPLTGGKVKPFHLAFEGRSYRPREIHDIFYGRAHLTFGWSRAQQALTLPWQHLPEFCSAVVEDAFALFGPAERPLAYVLGWMTHLVGDGLIKSIWPGVTLNLLDGKYTPRNRPIQDLYTYHEVGRKELGLNWPALLADVAQTPVEPIQPHYLRAAAPRGRLAHEFPDGWMPGAIGLLREVLAENRRYLKVYKEQVLQEMRLERTDDGWQCRDDLRRATGGLSYAQMIEAAEQANFRQTLRQIAEAVADLFGDVVHLVPALREMTCPAEPSWEELARQWQVIGER
jgi:hypothetical protein